jgi:flagellar protein FlaG
MGIERAQNLNSLSSQEQNTKDKAAVHIKKQEIPKEIKTSEIATEIEMKKVIDTLEKGIRQFNRRLKFDINTELNRIVVKVIDKDTEKVIREIPPSEIQNLLMKIREAIGLLYDTEI